MQIHYFTERPYRYLDEDTILDHGSFFSLPNSHFDRRRGAELYNAYLDEMVLCEEVGFDGVALNEHHGNPICLGGAMHLEAAILARITKRVKIMLVGTPLPISKHPLRVAEELATIDQISQGRLITGWLRGGGSEQFFNNANPAYNREMFEEAHDFIRRAWTTVGPWRYEGKHFHYRHVNPWPLPYQDPFPLAVVPGVLSAETAVWAAERRYPYIGLGTALPPTAELWDIYADTAAACGYQAGPENFGYMVPACVADTPEKADEIGRSFVFGGGLSAFASQNFASPPGYNSREAIQRLASSYGGRSFHGINLKKLMGEESERAAKVPRDEVRSKLLGAYQRAKDNMTVIVGTPDKVIEQAKVIMEVLRAGTVVLFSPMGDVSTQDRHRNIELLGAEVLPALRDYADELGLPSPFEQRPGERELMPGASRAPVVDRAPLVRRGMMQGEVPPTVSPVGRVQLPDVNEEARSRPGS